jgi:hypothetical protein
MKISSIGHDFTTLATTKKYKPTVMKKTKISLVILSSLIFLLYGCPGPEEPEVLKNCKIAEISTSQGAKVIYTYDQSGLVTKYETYFSNSGESNVGTITTSGNNRVLEIINSDGTKETILMTLGDNGYTSQLVSENDRGKYTTHYTYDPSGFLMQSVKTRERNGEIVSTSTTVYEYEGGNLIKSSMDTGSNYYITTYEYSNYEVVFDTNSALYLIGKYSKNYPKTLTLDSDFLGGGSVTNFTYGVDGSGKVNKISFQRISASSTENGITSLTYDCD